MKTITVDEFRQLSKPGPRKGEPRAGWEEEFAAQLEAERRAGRILSWAYEPIAIVLAHGGGGVQGLRYEPDFLVIDCYKQTLIYEVKSPPPKKGSGRRGRREGINKFKMAAEKHPYWQFYLVDKVKGEWRIRGV